MWFSRLENLFVAYEITCQGTNFSYANSLFPDNFVEQVSDAIFKPDPETPYNILKREAIRDASLTDQRAMNLLLDNVQLDDSTL